MALARIDQTTFEKVFPKSKDCFLLCFQTSLTSDEDLLGTIEKISSHFAKKLQAYLVDEDDLEFFQNKFNFWGTPTYIFLQDGEEKERLLGKVSEKTVTKFISRNLKEV